MINTEKEPFENNKSSLKREGKFSELELDEDEHSDVSRDKKVSPGSGLFDLFRTSGNNSSPTPESHSNINLDDPEVVYHLLPEVHISNGLSNEAKAQKPLHDATHVEMGENTTIIDEINCDQELNQKSDHIKLTPRYEKRTRPLEIGNQKGVQNDQANIMNGQTGTANRQTGAVNDQTGVVSGQPGVVNGQTGIANNQTGVLKDETNIVNSQAGDMNSQTFVVNDQTCRLNSQTDTASVQTGIVNVQTGVVDGQMKDQGKETCKNESSGILLRISRFLRRKRKPVKNQKDEAFDPSQSTDESITEC